MHLARVGALDAADADFRRVQDLDIGDYFEFAVERTELAQEDKEAGGAGLRYRVRAMLAGRVFEQVLVDVGFAPLTAQPEVVEGPDLLDFAGLPLVRVPALPAALHVAEKVHAYTRLYGPGGAPSSRPKDLVDVVLLAMHERFLAGELRAALEETFTSRGTHLLPEKLPPRPPNGPNRTLNWPSRSVSPLRSRTATSGRAPSWTRFWAGPRSGMHAGTPPASAGSRRSAARLDGRTSVCQTRR
jgi:hypothetical protein